MAASKASNLMRQTTARYPASSYERLYDSSLGPLWSSEIGLGVEEDGDHYSPERDFFEWWYFDASFDNGYRLVAILHSSLYNAVDHKPTLDIRVTAPGKPSITAIARFKRGDFHSESTFCDIQLGDCRAFLDEPGRYHLSLRQGPVSAELVYEAIAPGWRPGTGYLFMDQESGHYFKWVVPVPQALVSGHLVLEGQKIPVMGIGYHDHNWGNFFLPDAFSHWYWGRLTSKLGEKNWAAIFGDVAGRGLDPAHVRPFLLVHDGKVLSRSPQVEVIGKEARLEPATGTSFPEQMEVTAVEEGYRAKISLCAGKVIEAVDFARSPFRRRLPRQVSEMVFYLAQGKPLLGEMSKRLLGKASYLRLHAAAALDLEHDGIASLSGEAIYEVMQF
jgi:predicted secreted hydrolase